MTETIRQGNIERVAYGQVPIVSVGDKRVFIVSTREGCRVVQDCSQGRAVLETFEISKRFKVKNINLQHRRFKTMESMRSEFEKYEVEEVLRRMNNVDEIVYTDPQKVDCLKKLFSGLGKKVAVLPDGKVAGLGKQFTLWVQTDVCMGAIQIEAERTTEFILWEIVGFSCEV